MTLTLKVNVPPGSGRLVGSAVLSTVIFGVTSVTLTDSLSLSLSVFCSSSATVTSAVLSKVPALVWVTW